MASKGSGFMNTGSSKSPSQPTPPNGEPRPGVLAGVLQNRGFVACVVLLALLVGGFQGVIIGSGTKIIKKPLPPKKSLRLLDQSKLAPYRILQAADIKPEILDALGTREYIQWFLEDPTVEGNEPERLVQFFVTYYTDTPGQVPHVPEECYLGGGYRQTREEVIEIPIPGLAQRVPVKVLSFEKSNFLNRESKVVIYTFHTNGQFACDRQTVKAILGNPFSEHAYFSKVEVSFGTPEASPTYDGAIEAAKRFLAKALPVLLEDHWPDWEAAEKGSATSRPAPTSAADD